ncbi:MAG: hypothetical protein R3D05_05615 [Dongiaceae bacterium]
MNEVLIIAGLVAGGLAAAEVGYRFGSRFHPKDDTFRGQFDIVRGATFALVAFLIGFAFSGAGSRYVDRLDIIVKEANALGTAWLRTDLLSEPARGQVKAALKEFAANQLALLQSHSWEEADRLSGKVGELQRAVWSEAIAGVQSDPSAARLVLPALNDVFDLQSAHVAMAHRHLPTPILIVLLVTAALSLVLVGFGNGRSGRRFLLLDGVYATVLAVALWMTIDLDHPRQGIIQTSTQPVADALAQMQ